MPRRSSLDFDTPPNDRGKLDAGSNVIYVRLEMFRDMVSGTYVNEVSDAKMTMLVFTYHIQLSL